MVSYKDDRFGENEEFRVDLEPDLTGDVEDVHCGWSDGGDVKWSGSYVGMWMCHVTVMSCHSYSRLRFFTSCFGCLGGAVLLVVDGHGDCGGVLSYWWINNGERFLMWWGGRGVVGSAGGADGHLCRYVRACKDCGDRLGRCCCSIYT